MTDVAVLAYVPDPFAVQSSRFLIREPTGVRRHVNARELSEYSSPLLTYDMSALIDDLRRLEHSPPANILDIGDALRLLVGRSKDDGGEKLWNIWPVLKRRFPDKTDADIFERLALSRESRPETAVLSRLLEEAGDALARVWESLSSRLKHQGEFERLTKVEWPLQSAFAYRQYRGINIDASGAATLLERISAEKYAAYRQVAQHLSKSPTGLNFWNIQRHLETTDVSYLIDLEPGGQLQSAFEMAATASPFAAAFVALTRADRNANIVRRALGGTDRLFPIFHVMGTISGRILVSDPHLQQLRRAYRSLIVAEPNHRLIYLDYAQFEPGVLAGLSGDVKLIEAYNDGDLYTRLAEVLFGDAEQRPIAKRIFLAFSYGMTPGRIASMIAGGAKTQVERDAFAARITGFFDTFPHLAGYRARQQEVLLSEGYVESLMGNRRLRNTSGEDLSPKEQRWAMNQPVQSTASLIFKEALIGLIAEFGIEPITLPIHDAVLLQFPDDADFSHHAERASAIMVKAFERRIPGVVARVKAGDFAD